MSEATWNTFGMVILAMLALWALAKIVKLAGAPERERHETRRYSTSFDGVYYTDGRIYPVDPNQVSPTGRNRGKPTATDWRQSRERETMQAMQDSNSRQSNLLNYRARFGNHSTWTESDGSMDRPADRQWTDAEWIAEMSARDGIDYTDPAQFSFSQSGQGGGTIWETIPQERMDYLNANPPQWAPGQEEAFVRTPVGKALYDNRAKDAEFNQAVRDYEQAQRDIETGLNAGRRQSLPSGDAETGEVLEQRLPQQTLWDAFMERR